MTPVGRALRYGALLGALGYAAKVILIAAHECGHVLAALLTGAEVRGVRLYRVIGGSAFYVATDQVGSMVGTLGGVAIECLLGTIALVSAAKIRRPLLALFLSIFGVAALLSAACYSAMGLYYQWGDPARAAYFFLGDDEYWRVPLRGRGWWLVPVALLPLLAYLGNRVYVEQQARWLVASTKGWRALWTALAMAVAVAVVAPLLLIEYRWLPARESPSMLSGRHASDLARDQEMQARFRELQSQEPQLASSVAWSQVRSETRAKPPPTPKAPFPLWIVLVPLAVGGGVVALLRDASAGASHSVTRRKLMIAALVASCVLLVLLLSQGRFGV